MLIKYIIIIKTTIINFKIYYMMGKYIIINIQFKITTKYLLNCFQWNMLCGIFNLTKIKYHTNYYNNTLFYMSCIYKIEIKKKN